MLGVAADCPDALIGLTPVLQGGVHEAGESFPHWRHDLGGPAVELNVEASRMIPTVAAAARFQAPLPTRTGRSPYPDRWSRVRSVRSRSPPMPYMICSSGWAVEVTAGDGVEDEAEVLDRLPVEAEAVQRGA